MAFPAQTVEGETVQIVSKDSGVMTADDGRQFEASQKPNLLTEILPDGAGAAVEAAVEEVVDESSAAVGEASDEIGASLSELADEAGEAASEIVESVTDAASDIEDSVRDGVEDIKDALGLGGADEPVDPADDDDAA